MTSIGRGVGAWGDMVVTLNDGSKIEMRSLPRCAHPAGLRRCLLHAPWLGCRPCLGARQLGGLGCTRAAVGVPYHARDVHATVFQTYFGNAALCRFKEMEAYILQRRDELTGRNRGAPSGGSSAAEPAAAAPKGFS